MNSNNEDINLKLNLNDTINCVLTHRDAKLPQRSHDNDAGADLFSPIEIFLDAGARTKVNIGVQIELPMGYYAMVQAKSGLAANYGINTIGNIIDEGYRGDIHCVLINQGSTNVHFKQGEKIAQLIVMPYVKTLFKEVDKLSETERGEGGFGSTGKV